MCCVTQALANKVGSSDYLADPTQRSRQYAQAHLAANGDQGYPASHEFHQAGGGSAMMPGLPK